jgi:hypothetical protein
MLDYVSIFEELNKKKIQYLLVGGLAVNFHGVPRMTYDIDLLLYLSDRNINKFLKLMKDWGFSPKIPVDIMSFANKKNREDWIKNKNMKAFCLINPSWAISEIDIIIDSPIIYEKALRHSTIIKIQNRNVAVPIISISDLILMKKKSNRIQDKEDITNLRKLLISSGKNRNEKEE